MKAKTTKLLLSALVAAGAALAGAAETVAKGVWTADFVAATNAAFSSGTPIVLIASKSGCDHCAKLKADCLSASFTSWMAQGRFYFCRVERNTNNAWDYISTAGGAAAKVTDFPMAALVWPKARGGGVAATNFCARSGKMLVSAATGSLAAQLAASADKFFDGYDEGPSARFAVGNTVGDRLEAQAGYTTFVDVPVTREAGSDTSVTDAFTATFPDGSVYATTLAWTSGEVAKSVRVAIPDGAKAGETIALKLTCEGTAVTSAIAVVDRANSPKNPTWRGVSAFGEWTMDVAAAQAFAAKAREDGSGKSAYVLALLGGSLWCPDCARTDAHLVDTAAFAAWAKERRVVCAAVDIPNLSATAPTTGPCLLTRETKEVSQSYIDADPEHGAVQSGAGYLSRWMVSDEDAAAQLAANRALVGTSTEDGGLNRPERANRYRTGVPVFVVLNADGTVAARIETFASKSPAAFLEGYLDRLDELLAAADAEGTEDNVHEGTTTDAMRVDATEGATEGASEGASAYAATVSGGDLADVIELLGVDGAARTHVDVSAKVPAGLGLSVALLQRTAAGVSETLTNVAVSAASEAGRVSADFAAAAGMRYFAKVTLTGLEADDGAAKFGRSGDATASYSLAGSTEQVHGTVEFAETAQTFFVPDSEGSVTVQRTGGRSGAATVRIVVKDSGTVAGRFSLPETTVAWASGETGAKTVPFYAWREDGLTEGTFTLALEAVEETSVAVSGGTCAVTLFDTDKPCFKNVAPTLAMYSGFPQGGITLPLCNVTSNVAATLRRTSGALPSGVSLSYDRKSGQVVLKGTPKTPGTYTVTYTITQNRVTGLPATLTFTVTDPKTVNESVATARAAQDIPLLGEADDGTEILDGTLKLAVTAKNKVTAKYTGLHSTGTSYSGYWQTVEADTGLAVAELTARDGTTLLLEMDGDGAVRAEIPAYGIVGEAAWPRTDFARWAGHYTLTFPALDEEASEGGTPTALMDVTAAGKVRWTLVRSDGTKLAGSTTLLAYDEDADVAYAPLYKRGSRTGFGALVEIGADGATAWDKSTGDYAAQIVHEAPGTAAYETTYATVGAWRHAFGSWYSANIAPTALSETFGYSDAYAVVSPAFATRTILAEDRKFVLAETDSAFRFSFALKTGLFSGWAKVVAPSGKTVTAKFTGVLMPGWDECGECSEDFTAYERPFGSGTLTFKDGTAAYTYPIDIEATLSADE